MWGPEHPETLICAANQAAALSNLGEYAEAAVLLRTTLAARTRMLGADDEITLIIEGHLISARFHLGEYAEAEALSRGALEKERRVFGSDHRSTLVRHFAASLLAQGKHAEAAEVEREVLASTFCLLGAEHADTPTSAGNLACTLVQCGQKKEGEQIFRGTLALCQRTLGPAHEISQSMLQHMRTFGIAAQ